MVCRNHLEGGGLGLLGPTSLVTLKTSTMERPVPRELENCVYRSSTDFLWYSMLWKSAHDDQCYSLLRADMAARTDVTTLRLRNFLLLLLLLSAPAVFDVI